MATERIKDSRVEGLSWFRKSRETRRFKSVSNLIPSVTSLKVRSQSSNSRVELAPNEPHPTRSFYFEWKPKSKTIQISLDPRSRRQAKWVGLDSDDGFKAQKARTGVNITKPNLTLVGPVTIDGPGCMVNQEKEMGLLIDKPQPKLLESGGDDILNDVEGSESELACEQPRTTPIVDITQF